MKRLVSALLVFLIAAGSLALGEAALDAQAVLEKMQEGNGRYILSEEEGISPEKRADTFENGQHPYAVVITCSDSRVPAEYIFDAGIGELFVVRTAGNVIGNYELGSIEYGAEHLRAPVVVVMGHTGCGAVAAALGGEAHGHIADIVKEISSCIYEGCDAARAEILNVENSIARIRSSEIMRELEESGAVRIVGAIYNIETGAVEFMQEQPE